jgi:DNA-binding Xre family transcriptional regulator
LIRKHEETILENVIGAHKKGEIMTNTYELEKVIRQNGLTKRQVAAELGLSEQGFLLKLTNKNEFKASEIEKLCVLLGLPDNSLFFYKGE